MSRRVLTVDRYKEIERLLAAGRGVREITRALKCSRRLVRQIRDGLHGPPEQPRSTADPPWMAQIPSSPMPSATASSTRRSPSTSPGRVTARSKPASLRRRRKTRKHPLRRLCRKLPEGGS